MKQTVIKPGTGSTKINAILKKGGNIKFLAGTYNVTTPMRLRSNTNVECEPGVIFFKKCSDAMLRILCMKSIIKYKGLCRITWKGGKFVGVTSMATSNLVEMCHARLITFEDAQFVSVRGLHFIEINACKDIVIRNCKFGNHITYSSKPHKEAIQIDFANIDGFPYGLPTSRMYDGQHCKNILIEGCKFSECNVCIGTHTVTTDSKKYHEKITIKDNVAVGRNQGTFFRVLNMRNVCVVGNQLRDFENGVYIDYMKTGHDPKGGKVELPDYVRNQKVICHNNEFENVTNPIHIK